MRRFENTLKEVSRTLEKQLSLGRVERNLSVAGAEAIKSLSHGLKTNNRKKVVEAINKICRIFLKATIDHQSRV